MSAPAERPDDDLREVYEQLLRGSRAPSGTARRVAGRVRARRRSRRLATALTAGVAIALAAGVAVGAAGGGLDGSRDERAVDAATPPQGPDDETDGPGWPNPSPTDLTCPNGTSSSAPIDRTEGRGATSPDEAVRAFLAGPTSNGSLGPGERLLKRPRDDSVEVLVVRADDTARARFHVVRDEGWRLTDGTQCSQGLPPRPAPPGAPGAPQEEVTCATGGISNVVLDFSGPPIGAPIAFESAEAFLAGPAGTGAVGPSERLVENRTADGSTEVYVVRPDQTVRAIVSLQRGDGWGVTGAQQCVDGAETGVEASRSLPVVPSQALACPGPIQGTDFDFVADRGVTDPAEVVMQSLDGEFTGGPLTLGERLVEVELPGPTDRVRGDRAEILVLRADGTARARFNLLRREGWLLESASRCAPEPGADPTP